MHGLPSKHEMGEMISEYVNDASLISFQFLNEMKIYSDGSKWEQNWWSNKMITSYKLLYEINMIEHTTSKGWKEEMLMEFLNDSI